MENSFQLVLMSEAGDTQISVIWNDLDQKRVEEVYCEGCKTKKLRKSISGLVKKLVGKTKENEIQDQQPKKVESKQKFVTKIQSLPIHEKLESSSEKVMDPSTKLILLKEAVWNSTELA